MITQTFFTGSFKSTPKTSALHQTLHLFNCVRLFFIYKEEKMLTKFTVHLKPRSVYYQL